MVGVETHVFRNAAVSIVALMTNPQLRVDELGSPEFKSNDRFAKPMTVRLALLNESFIYDLRAAKPLGRRSDMKVTLDPYEPVIFALAPSAIGELQISCPTRLKRGDTAELGIRFAAPTPAARHVLHVDVVNPSGKVVGYYSGNLLAPGGRTSKLVPLALSDPAGRWQVHVRDLLTGQSRISSVEVF